MSIIGKSTINPLLYYTGKISGYIIWVFYIFSIVDLGALSNQQIYFLKISAHFLAGLGLILVLFSFKKLGDAVRIGQPSDITELKTNGIYRFSRNPIYVGFDLLSIASILYIWNILVIIAGLYSIIVYHFIIMGEEKFLEKRFNEKYLEYKKKTRRYI